MNCAHPCPPAPFHDCDKDGCYYAAQEKRQAEVIAYCFGLGYHNHAQGFGPGRSYREVGPERSSGYTQEPYRDQEQI